MRYSKTTASLLEPAKLISFAFGETIYKKREYIGESDTIPLEYTLEKQKVFKTTFRGIISADEFSLF